MSSNKDLSMAVNAFMLSSAPTLVEASPMGYDMLTALAVQLIFKVRTTVEHAGYVMHKKYQHIYVKSVIDDIIKSAICSECESRLTEARKKRAAKKAMVQCQPMLSFS